MMRMGEKGKKGGGRGFEKGQKRARERERKVISCSSGCMPMV